MLHSVRRKHLETHRGDVVVQAEPEQYVIVKSTLGVYVCVWGGGRYSISDKLWEDKSRLHRSQFCKKKNTTYSTSTRFAQVCPQTFVWLICTLSLLRSIAK